MSRRGCDGVLHRLVQERREQKADADLGDALLDPLFRRVDFDAQRAQHVGAAGLARHRAVAMLGDVDARAGNDERRGGGNIESALLIAAGAAGVEHGFRADIDAMRFLAHHPRRAGDLLDGFALHAQGGQKRRHLQRRRFAGHDLIHDVDGSASDRLTRLTSFSIASRMFIASSTSHLLFTYADSSVEP